jgi:hypothetical protein
MTEAQKKPIDQRATSRVPLVLSATISVPVEGLVLPCVLTDLSATGAGLQYEGTPPGANLARILDVAKFGRFNGFTVRNAGQVRGFKFAEGEAEREKLKEKLIEFVARGIGKDASIHGPAGIPTWSSLYRAACRRLVRF